MLWRRMLLRWVGALGTVGALPVGMPAWAQGKYPDQPIKLIVALPAGGRST
jgi:tripartite-type tricarboxylate transporter receptor subunit TctC